MQTTKICCWAATPSRLVPIPPFLSYYSTLPCFVCTQALQQSMDSITIRSDYIPLTQIGPVAHKPRGCSAQVFPVFFYKGSFAHAITDSRGQSNPACCRAKQRSNPTTLQQILNRSGPYIKHSTVPYTYIHRPRTVVELEGEGESDSEMRGVPIQPFHEAYLQLRSITFAHAQLA